jgi:hypothetical protein
MPREFGFEVSSMYDTAIADAPEKAVDGMPSKAAFEAAPLI